MLWRSPSFSTEELSRLRARFASRDFSARPTLVFSQWLYIEMAAHLQNPKVADLIGAQLAFLEQLPDFLFLHEHPHVLRSEVATALRGAPPDLFIAEGWMIPVGSEEVWRSQLERRDAERAQFIATMTAAQRSFWSQFSMSRGEVVRSLRDHVLSGLALYTASWALDDMQLAFEQLGLPNDPRAWPFPDQLRTLWARAAFGIAYLYQLDLCGRAIDANDFHDWAHYIAAAHADEFVTSDRRQFAIAELCVPPKPKVSGFDEWAKRLLSA